MKLLDTTAGDKAYAALSPEGRKKQDSAYLAAKNREEVKTRFIPDSLKMNLKNIWSFLVLRLALMFLELGMKYSIKSLISQSLRLTLA